jgi:hypothetical protein
VDESADVRGSQFLAKNPSHTLAAFAVVASGEVPYRPWAVALRGKWFTSEAASLQNDAYPFISDQFSTLLPRKMAEEPN